MTGRIRLCTVLVACLLTAAPAAAQVDVSNPSARPHTAGVEHPRYERHRAWRAERQSRRLAWRGHALERRGERWQNRGRWLRHHGQPMRGRAYARQGRHWEGRGNRYERRGERLDHRADRLRYRSTRGWRRGYPDGRI
jgi:hypothetical protein